MEVVTSGQTWVGFRCTEPVGFADNLDGWSESRCGVKGHLKVSILGSSSSVLGLVPGKATGKERTEP